MLKLFMSAAAAVALGYPQTRVAIRLPQPAQSDSSTTRPSVVAARPLLGYVSEGSSTLFSVVGSTASPSWGESISLPKATSQAFLPPRQEYALLASDGGLSVALLSRSALSPGLVIANAIARPDRVAFSPSGAAVAIVSNLKRLLQVLTYRNGNVNVLRNISFANPTELVNFTVSDDGELVMASFANQPPVYSVKGSAWHSLTANCAPRAWSFLPGSHDLVLSDRLQNTIVLLPHAEDAFATSSVLLQQGGDIDLIAADHDGSSLLAAIRGTSAMWQIDISSRTAQQVSARSAVSTLIALRDGTFLTSVENSPELVNLKLPKAQFRATAGVR